MSQKAKVVASSVFLMLLVGVSTAGFLRWQSLFDMLGKWNALAPVVSGSHTVLFCLYVVLCLSVLTVKSPRVEKGLKTALLLCAFYFVGSCLFVMFSRIGYPYELEWMESESRGHVDWVLSGHLLYSPPSLEFTSSIYPPLYFYLGAVISKLMAGGFLPLRLISLASSMTVLIFIFLMVKRETTSHFLAVVSTGFFAATFDLSGVWFDLARVDMLFLALLLAGIYVLRFSTSWGSYVTAAVLIWLSFLTKQTTLFIVVPALFFLAFTNRKAAIFFVGTFVLLTGASLVILDLIHGGWFNYYVFYLPSQHPVTEEVYLGFWRRNLFWAAPVACLVSIFYFLRQWNGDDRKIGVFYFMIAMGACAGSWISLLHSLGHVNVLLPTYAVLAVLFGLGIRSFWGFVEGVSWNWLTICCSLRSLFLFVCIAQFILLLYQPSKHIPSPADISAGGEFLDKIRQMEGEVLVPYHSYLPVLAGKTGYAHQMALYDVLRSKDVLTRTRLSEEIKKAIGDRKFSLVVVDEVDWFREELEKYYEMVGHFFDDSKVFFMRSGWSTRPEFIYVPKRNGVIVNQKAVLDGVKK